MCCGLSSLSGIKMKLLSPFSPLNEAIERRIPQIRVQKEEDYVYKKHINLTKENYLTRNSLFGGDSACS